MSQGRLNEAVVNPAHQKPSQSSIKRKEQSLKGKEYVESLQKTALTKTHDSPLVVDLWTIRSKTAPVSLDSWKFVEPPAAVDVIVDSENALGDTSLAASIAPSGMAARCNLCGITQFDGGVDEQRRHFKSRWHFVNLRLKAKNKSAVSEEDSREYAASSDSDDDDDLDENDRSSKSGTDREDDEEDDVDSVSSAEESPADQVERIKQVVESEKRATKTDIELEGEVTIAAYRATAKDLDEVKDLLTNHQPQVWGVILYQSGHFASAIFHEGKLKEHQTEHRYTQRKKQGGSQASHDQKGSKAKSAGAMLRRYGEQSMQEKVRFVLEQWDWDQCTRLYFAVPERARKLFLLSGRKHKSKERKENRFSRHDPRVRKVPFITTRPTMSECERVFHVLSQAEFFATPSSKPTPPEDVSNDATATKATKTQTTTPKLTEAARMELVRQQEIEKYRLMGYEDLLIHRAAQDDDVVTMEKALKELKNPVNSQAMNGDTSLHIACYYASVNTLPMLLEQGADVAKKDLMGRVPFQRCRDPETRMLLREFRGEKGESFTDWKLALIPEPPKARTEDELEAKRQKEREKRKRQQDRKKQDKAKEKVVVPVVEAIPLEMQCAQCKKALPAKLKDRFSQGEYEFCAAQCMREHTRRLAADAAERTPEGYERIMMVFIVEEVVMMSCVIVRRDSSKTAMDERWGF